MFAQPLVEFADFSDLRLSTPEQNCGDHAEIPREAYPTSIPLHSFDRGQGQRGEAGGRFGVAEFSQAKQLDVVGHEHRPAIRLPQCERYSLQSQIMVTVHGLFPRSSPVPAQHLGPATSLAIQNVVVGVSLGLRGLGFRRYDEIARTPFL